MAVKVPSIIDTSVNPPEVRVMAAGEVVGYDHGGTGLAAYSKGDIVIASAINTLSALAVGSATQFLGVTAGAPAWKTISVALLSTPTLTNNNVSSAPIGTPVYLVNTTATFDFAKADAYATALVYGVVGDTSIASSAAGNVITSGLITFASTAQVDAVTDTVGGFDVFGEYFYLSDTTAGKLTDAQPSSGHHMVPVLKAITNLTAQVLGPNFVALGI